MKVTNSFMVSSRILSYRTTNPVMVLETMKRTMSSSMKLLKDRYVSDLMSRLCQNERGGESL